MSDISNLLDKIKQDLTVSNFRLWLNYFANDEHIIGNGGDGDDCPLHHFSESLLNNPNYRVVIGYFGYYITNYDDCYSLGYEILPEWAQIFNSMAVRYDLMDVSDCLSILDEIENGTLK